MHFISLEQCRISLNNMQEREPKQFVNNIKLKLNYIIKGITVVLASLAQQQQH